MLKPSLLYINDASDCEKDTENVKESTEEQRLAEGALKVFESSLNTPDRQRYSQRIEEGYNVEGVSPCFDVYKKLHNKANPSDVDKGDRKNASALLLLAHVAFQQANPIETEDVTSPDIRPTKKTDSDAAVMSPLLAESMVFPKAADSSKPKRQLLIDSLPDNLTSLESISQISLKELKKLQAFAERGKKAKIKYQKQMTKLASQKNKKKKACMPKGNKTKSLKYKPKATEKSKHDSSEKEVDFDQERTIDSRCQACHSTEADDEAIGIELKYYFHVVVLSSEHII